MRSVSVYSANLDPRTLGEARQFARAFLRCQPRCPEGRLPFVKARVGSGGRAFGHYVAALTRGRRAHIQAGLATFRAVIYI